MIIWITEKITSRGDDQGISLMFWSSSCRAQLRKAHSHTSGISVKWLVSTQLTPCRPPPPSRCMCPPSSPLWSPVTVSLPATSTSNHILSVTQRQEVLQGKKKVGNTKIHTVPGDGEPRLVSDGILLQTKKKITKMCIWINSGLYLTLMLGIVQCGVFFATKLLNSFIPNLSHTLSVTHL